MEAEVEVVVGEQRVGRIERAVRGEETAAIEGGLVVDEVAGEPMGAGIVGVAAAIGVGGFAGGDSGSGAGEQDGGEGEDFGGGEAIVGAKEEEPLATRDGDGAVHGIVYAGVGGAGKMGEARAVSFKPGDGAVGGGAVDDDDLGAEVVLIPDAGESGGEARAGVFADDDDADERRWSGHCVGDELQVGVGRVHAGFYALTAAFSHHRRV